MSIEPPLQIVMELFELIDKFESTTVTTRSKLSILLDEFGQHLQFGPGISGSNFII